MGSKKRGNSSIDDNGVVVKRDDFVEKIDSKKKKLNLEEKNDDGEKGEIPMETKKKRKMLDKERRRIESQANELKPVKTVVNSVANVEGDAEEMEMDMGVRDDQPVFHIDVFGDLASGDDVRRKAAAERLAVELKEVQKAFEKVGSISLNNGGSKLEAEKDDGLDNCAESVRYAVRRLVRGVSSSRECARQGFSLGLTILLATNMTVRLDSVIKLVDDLLEVTSSMKGQEARDVLLGRLFAYGAVVRSRRLKEESDCIRNTPLIKEVTSLLISLASKKRYLQEPAVAVLWDLIEMLPKEAVLKHILDTPGVREWFNGATDSGNPDALLLAMRVREKIATDSEIFGPLLPRPFSSSQFFTVEHLTSIAKCLKESTFCQPRVHGIWPLLVNMLLPDTLLQDANCSSSLTSSKKHKKSRRASSSDEDSEAKLKIFNEVVLEDSLLTGSHDRKHLVFDILLLMLPRLPASYLPIVLSLKFVQCLMDVLSTTDSWLHKVAINFLMKVSDWVESDDIRRTFVIVALQKHSGGRFDSISRTRTVKDLMTAFTTESGCILFIQKLSSIFIDEDPIVDEPSDENQPMDEESEMVTVQTHGSESSSKPDILKSWVVESLPGLLKYLTLDLEAKVKVQKEVMKFLAVQGLFSATLGTEVTSFELEETFRWPQTPISSALSRKCVDQLQLLLSNAQKAEAFRALTNGLETNDLGCYFMRFLGTFCAIPSVSPVRPLSNDDEIAFKTVLDMESRLSREGRNWGLSAEANKVHALRYLLIQLLLQLLLRPGEIAEAASELIICCRKAFPVNDDAESSGDEESDDGESPALMDVLVDTLLSLLPQSSAPLRSAVEQVFRYFCEDITDDGLMRMLRIVKKDLKRPRRKNKTKGKEGEEKEEEEEEEEDDEEEDDLLDLEEAEESNEAGDNSGAAVHADASDEEVSDADEDDDNADDSDNDDDDVEMDDEAMFRFDAIISKIFQERKNKAGANSPHAQLLVFKFRVLSLVEIYLHENPGSTRVLTAYANLVQAFVKPTATEGSEQLAQRIMGVLQKKVFRAKDYPKGDDVQLSTLETLLGKSLKLASRRFYRKKAPQTKQTLSRNRFKTINSVAQQSTHWILKIIDGRKFPEAELGRVFDFFKVAIKKYFNKKSFPLKPEFLKEVIKRRPWVGQHIFGFLLKECGDAKYGYRRVEALDLVQELLKSVVQSTPDGPKMTLKPHLSELSHLVHQLAAHMPEKQARRSEVRKFCGKVFQIVSTNYLAKSFLKTLDPDANAVCESQFGETFLALKKTEK